MYYSRLRTGKHCRWCQQPYKAKKPYDKDGFCSPACKQAHYRAYKNYVTQKNPAAAPLRGRKVTRKRKE